MLSPREAWQRNNDRRRELGLEPLSFEEFAPVEEVPLHVNRKALLDRIARQEDGAHLGRAIGVGWHALGNGCYWRGHGHG